MVKRVGADGAVKADGRKGLLAQSGHYPPKLGAAIVNAWLHNHEWRPLVPKKLPVPKHVDLEKVRGKNKSTANDPWAHPKKIQKVHPEAFVDPWKEVPQEDDPWKGCSDDQPDPWANVAPDVEPDPWA